MPHSKTRFVRQTRREAAEARATEYASLTVAERLAQIDSRRGESKKERARLEAQLPASEIESE